MYYEVYKASVPQVSDASKFKVLFYCSEDGALYLDVLYQSSLGFIETASAIADAKVEFV